jgi:HEAT repeat protein
MNEQQFCDNVRELISQKNVNASRLKATKNLGKSGDHRAVPYLIYVLGDKNFPYRFVAIRALASLGGAEATRFLERLWTDLEDTKGKASIYEDYNYVVSQEAFVAAALYKLGKEDYIAFVFDLVKSDDETIRYNATAALGMVSNEKSRKTLYDILRKDSMDLPKCGAATALVELQDPDVYQTVREMLKRKEGPIECFESLVRDQGKSAPSSSE